MFLFNLQRFSERYGIDLSVGDFNNAVIEAARGATATMASRFRFTDFNEYTARRDIFACERTFGQGNTLTRSFLLARGFTSKANVTAYYATSPIHLRNADLNNMVNLEDALEDGESDMLFVDEDQGLLTVYGIDLTGLWVLVDYTGGLSIATDDEYEGVPEWLSEAAMLQAAMNLSTSKVLKIDDEDGDDFSILKDQLKTALVDHRRYHPAAVKPTASEPGT